MGFANRFEEGSLFWWCADYPHYEFLTKFPAYDFYVFVEYDAIFSGSFGEVVSALAADGVDFAAFPLSETKEEWHWSKPHAAVYSLEELEGCLMCISVFSRRALTVLAERRLAMSRAPQPAYWPSAEAFLLTEVKRAGLKFASLERFGHCSQFSWRPPHMERDAATAPSPSFIHPVYDQARYVQWALAQGQTLRDMVTPQGPVLRKLLPLPLQAYLLPLAAATGRRLRASVRRRRLRRRNRASTRG